MNIDKLNKVFDEAIQNSRNYIVVTVEDEITQIVESIVFNTHFFKTKQDYYNHAYTNDCRLQSYKYIKITGVQIYDTIIMR